MAAPEEFTRPDAGRTLLVLMPGPHSLASVRLAADGWTVRAGKLTLRYGAEPAAEFAPGQWAGVVDDSRMQAEAIFGGLLAARRALGQIAEGCREGWLRDLDRIARIAADGLMEVAHEGLTEP